MLRGARTCDNAASGGSVARAPDARRLVARLLAWYDRNRRALPWRAPKGTRPDPYRVWLSEVMLQQTTVAAAEPYFRRFLARWPDVESLARAPLDAVLREWQGLGYYARARNLHACARRIVRDHGGRFPAAEAELRRLPGVGPYSAAAISAIAFGRRAAAVDGNVLRVMARLHGVTAPLPSAKGRLCELAAAMTPANRPGDYAQAVMDLGAVICTPKRPACGDCPWQGVCAARASGAPEALPRKEPRRPRPLRHGVAFVLERADGAVWLRRRPARGLLGGMMEVPTTDWREVPFGAGEAKRSAPLEARWRKLPGRVRHRFTHFELELRVLLARLPAGADGPGRGRWVAPEKLGGEALPTLMKKVIRHARPD